MVRLYTTKIDFGREMLTNGLASVVRNTITIPVLNNDALSLSQVVTYPCKVGDFVGVLTAVDTTLNTINVTIDPDFYEFPSDLFITTLTIEVFGVDILELGGTKNILEEHKTTSFSSESRLVSRVKRFKAIVATKRIVWDASTIEQLISSEAFLKYSCDEDRAYEVSIASESLTSINLKARGIVEFHIGTNITREGVGII